MFQTDLLRDRVALITGGGSGLGLAMARSFAALGARVALLGRNVERLEAARTQLGIDAGRTLAVPADVRDPAAVAAAVESVERDLGAIDVLVNNAAGNFLAASETLSPNGFDAIVRIVLHGTFHCSAEAGRRMIARGRGSILNIVATYAWTGSAYVVPSAAAKAGVLALTRSLAVEWAAHGVRVNAIAPGPFPTEGAWSRLMPSEQAQAAALERVPAGRFGDPEELARLAVFLVSDAAPFITGEVVTIDGGEWLASGGQFSGLRTLDADARAALMRRARSG